MTVFPPSSSADAGLAREIVGGLIESCRDGEHAFELAARSVVEPILRAELVQYSVQRREFIAELHEAILSIGEDADDRGGMTVEGGRWSALKRAANRGDVAGVIEACTQFDQEALGAYRNGVQARLPYAVASVIHSQFIAFTRVESRLRVLADVARGKSPIDKGDE